MPNIVICGPDLQQNSDVVRELIKVCRKTLRRHKCILNVQKRVLQSYNVTERTEFQCDERFFEKILNNIVVEQCNEENTEENEFITENCIVTLLSIAETCIGDTGVTERILSSSRGVRSALEHYKCMLVVVLGPSQLPFDDGIWMKLGSQEKWKCTLLNYKHILKRFGIPFLDLSSCGVEETCSILSDAIAGKIQRNNSNLSYYEGVAQKEKHGDHKGMGNLEVQKSFSFYIKSPNKPDNIYIPTISVFEHYYEQSWTDLPTTRTNRFIQRHGHENLLCMSFHRNLRSSIVHKTLMNSVTVNGEVYSFLGCSSGGLKTRKCYLWKGNTREASQILHDDGDFDSILTVSKRLSRIALLFTAVTQTGVRLEDEHVIRIEDICDQKGQNFSDGCGLIGKKVAKELSEEVKDTHELSGNDVPSVFQVRFQGFKGVLVVDKNIEQSNVAVRPSMEKFSTRQYPCVGVCNFSKPYTFGHLNRQFIQLLSGLNIPDNVFLQKQKEYFDMITNMLTKSDVAVRCLHWQNNHEKALQIAQAGGLDKLPSDSQREIMKELRKTQQQLVSKVQKLNILVPESRTVFGICDTSSSLQYGECFLRLTIDGKLRTIRGQVVVCKNPCYLLGDVRVLTALDDTDRPELAQLNHLKDCIVFPVKGKRPHPNEIAGSDLDGDEYFVTWDESLIPKTTRPPYDYPSASTPREGPVTEEGIISYFAKQNETVKLIGKVNNFYNKWADLKGVTSSQCERLGQLFSRVIDSGKSGEEIDVPRDLKPPDLDKPTHFVWNVMEENAASFEKNFKSEIIQRESVEDITNEFVHEIVGKSNSNISEFDKFSFCWKYLMFVHSQDEEVLEDFMTSFAKKITFSLMSIEERKYVIDKGVPQKYVMNALNKSQILTKRDLEQYKMDVPENTWAEYATLLHEEFDWVCLYKTLTQNDCNLLVLEMPDNVVIEIQFLEKLSKGIEQPISPGTVSAILYSKHFGKTCRYILGGEYVLDLSEDTLQLYREGKKNLTFVWLKASDRKATRGHWNKPANDEVVNSISVDLQRFDRRILQGNRHPLVNKTPFIRMEIYSQNYFSTSYPYWDTFDANDVLPVEDSVEESTEDEGDFQIDFQRAFPMEEPPTVSLSESVISFAAAEQNPYFFRSLLEQINICDHQTEIVHHFQNLLKHITSVITPFVLPESLQTVLVEILMTLAEYLENPLDILAAIGYLEVLGIYDIAEQLSEKGYKNKSVDIKYFLSIVENWQNVWRANLETAHNVLQRMTSNDCGSMNWSNSDPNGCMVEKYLHKLGLLHSLTLIQELDECKTKLKQAQPKSNSSQNSVLNLRVVCSDMDEPGTVSFYRTQAMDNVIQFSQGQYVCIQRQKSPGSTLLVGRIHSLRIAPFHMTVKTSGEIPQSILLEINSNAVKYFRADLIGNIVTYERVCSALKHFCEKKDESSVINCISSLMFSSEEDKLNPANIDLEQQVQEEDELNDKQREAVSAALQTTICLIQGPPGTGKTKVACCIVQQILQLKLYEGLLVVAETNTAVDNLARRLRSDMQVVRIGSGEAIAKDLYPLTLEEQVNRIAEKEAKRAKRKDQHGDIHRDKRLIKRVLCAADVVLATCSGAGDPVLDGFSFEFVLVDEATQTLETTLLCSLQHGVKHLVMIGDQKQLGPTLPNTSTTQCIHKDLPSPSELKETLFHRLMNEPSVYKCFLDIQHRMHPEIMAFPSQEFYEGQLKAASFLAGREEIKFPWPKVVPYKPLCFVNVEQRETKHGTSYFNKREAEVVQKVVDVLLNVDEERLREFRLAVTDIAILTMYQAQVLELKRKLHKGITVSSVDGFQGQEKEVIVVSTVRCNSRQSVGFAGDPQRINVLLTRAKRGLIVVGHEQTLQGSEIWRKWLTTVSFLKEKDIMPVIPKGKNQDIQHSSDSNRLRNEKQGKGKRR